MIKGYRITKATFVNDLSGGGAKLYGGRWNQKGTPMLYLGENRSVAVLEALVHVPFGLLPSDMKIVEVSIPKTTIKTYTPDKLREGWDSFPPPEFLAKIGTTWINSKMREVLKVPSVISPGEWNFLINPFHGDFKKIKIVSVEDYSFNIRLFREIKTHRG